MSEDTIICYCFGVKRDVIEAYLEKPDVCIDDIIRETKITTKCAACSVDFDQLIDAAHTSERMGRVREAALAASAWGIRERMDRVDSGFFICDDDIQTSLRLANYPPFSGNQTLCTPHRFRLSLFSNDGKLCAKRTETISPNEERTIAFPGIKGCPEQGWFLLHMQPIGPGRYGTLRPQVVLKGKGWVSCYHTQYHTDATRARLRSGAPLLVAGARTRSVISIINGSPRESNFTVTLEGGPNREEKLAASGRIAGNGACLFDVDANFPSLPSGKAIFLRVESNEPTRKNVINVHPDGSLGVDHFPNIV